MNAYEIINYEPEFDLKNPHTPIKEEIIGTTLYKEMMQLTMNPLKKLTMCKLVMMW
jgi:hypothetical protein